MSTSIEHTFPDQDDLAFNPNEYTEKELLKLVYRELHRLRTEFDDYRKNNTWEKRITTIESDLAIHKALNEASDKRTGRIITYVSVGLTLLALILKFLVH